MAPKSTEGVMSTAEMAQALKEAVPEAPVPRITLPLWAAYLLVKLGYNPNLDEYMYEGMTHGPGPGYSSNMGTLDFEYRFTDAVQSVKDTALSMKELGILELEPTHGAGALIKQVLAAIAILALIVVKLRRLLRGGTEKRKAS